MTSRPDPQHSALLTCADVAAHLGCSDKTVRRLAHAGRLPALRLGRTLRFEATALDALRIVPVESKVPA